MNIRACAKALAKQVSTSGRPVLRRPVLQLFHVFAWLTMAFVLQQMSNLLPPESGVSQAFSSSHAFIDPVSLGIAIALGAGLGGAGSAATGGDPLKGALIGAGGGLLGGVAGPAIGGLFGGGSGGGTGAGAGAGSGAGGGGGAGAGAGTGATTGAGSGTTIGASSGSTTGATTGSGAGASGAASGGIGAVPVNLPAASAQPGAISDLTAQFSGPGFRDTALAAEGEFPAAFPKFSGEDISDILSGASKVAQGAQQPSEQPEEKNVIQPGPPRPRQPLQTPRISGPSAVPLSNRPAAFGQPFDVRDLIVALMGANRV